MKVHLIDGTYELFRQHYGQATRHSSGPVNAATIGVLNSTLQLIADGATHIAVASDHVIESFRNDLWAGYKTSEGMAEELLVQIPLMEQALGQMGIATWGMIAYEADDALASAAALANADSRVEQVLIITPDKDLGQCVRGTRVVQFDRRKNEIIDEDAVTAKFGVPPSSIADYLALVGDSADGYPGIAGWGAKSTSSVLARFGTIEAIPASADDWGTPPVRGAATLAAALQENMEQALLFRTLATVVDNLDVDRVDDWCWQGPLPGFAALAEQLGAPKLAERASRLAKKTQTPAE